MTTLARTLTVSDLVAIGVGTIIGSGIFLVPGGVLQHTDHALGLALVVWTVGGILSVLGALTYGELGAMKPDAGGIYTYVRDAFGQFPAFLYGWTMFFLITSGSVATLSVAFANYLGEFVTLSDAGRTVAAVAMIAVITWVNVAGTRGSARLQTWTTVTKAGALVVMAIALLAMGTGFGGAPIRWWPGEWSMPVVSGAGLALLSVLWAYEGWQYVTYAAGETIDPQRVFARGIVAGTLLVIVLYLLANVGYVAALGVDGVAASTRIAADATSRTIGPWAAKLVSAAILVSMFSAANGVTLTASRLYYAMARDGVFFARLAQLDARRGTPATAIVASGIWAALLAMSGTFQQLLTYVVFAGWFFYGLGGASIFYYRTTRPEVVRPFRTPGYPLTPALFVLSAAAVVGNTLVSSPREALVGVVLMLLGAPGYAIWRSRGGAADTVPAVELD